MAPFYDTIIVSGGTADCVIASRLTEDSSQSVLLLKAGQNYPRTSRFPTTIQFAEYVPMSGHAPECLYGLEHNWNLNLKVSSDGSSMQVPQGKLKGGGSAINWSISLRGSAMNYDKD
jgi:choline dehydrogenase